MQHHHEEKKRTHIGERDRVVRRIHRDFEMRIGVNKRMIQDDPCMFMNLPGEEGSYIIEDWSKGFAMATPIEDCEMVEAK